MRKYRNTPYDGELDVVATLSERAIAASLAELRSQDELTLALRAAQRIGVSIDTLSAESGLTPEEIRNRLRRNLTFGEDLAAVTGEAR